LVALERRGYLQRNENSGRYSFGLKVFTLANAGLKGMALREISYPILAALMRQTGLTVHMAIMDRDHVVLIEQIVPPPEIAPMTWPGERLELHCTARPSGKRQLRSFPRISGTGSSRNGRCRATTKTPSVHAKGFSRSWRLHASGAMRSTTKRSICGCGASVFPCSAPGAKPSPPS